MRKSQGKWSGCNVGHAWHISRVEGGGASGSITLYCFQKRKKVVIYRTHTPLQENRILKIAH